MSINTARAWWFWLAASSAAIGWAINAEATTLNGYYFGMIVAGIGAGAVYGTCVGNALKWFPDKRGLAAGITAAGFGAGSALTVAPIQAMIKDSGFQTTFLYFGLGQGIIIVILAFFLFAPKAGQVPAVIQNANVIQTRRNYQPTEVIRHPIFWLMYFMFVLVGAGGLMVTANLKPIAVDWKIDSMPVTLMAMTMTTVTFAATIDRVLNGLTRPFFGWISDMIGRENTMFIAFGIEGIGIWALYMLGHDPVWFVMLSGHGVLRLGRDLFSVPLDLHRHLRREIRHHQCRPALYRQRHRGPAGAGRRITCSNLPASWDRVFLIAAGANILASLLAIVVLKPWRKTVVAKSHRRLDPRTARLFPKRAHPKGWARFFFALILLKSLVYLQPFGGFRTHRAWRITPIGLRQNVSIIASFAVLEREYDETLELTIGIMYTNLISTKDVLRLI